MSGLNPIRVSISRDMTDIMNHTQSVITQDVLALNEEHFEGYQWIAVLDSKTCLICGKLDNRIFRRLPNMKGGGDKAPDQPIHENCRCVMAPVLEGTSNLMASGPSYEDWLHRQSDATKLDILGPSRFQLYKQGMRITQFVRDDNILTLEQLGADRLKRKQLLDTAQIDVNRPLTSHQRWHYRQYLMNQMKDNGFVSDAAITKWADAIMAKIDKMPPKMQHLISQNRSRIVLNPNIDTAVFDSYNNIINMPLGKLNRASGSLDTFFHEMGHAIDFQHGRPSSRLNLRDDYKEFLRRVDAMGTTDRQVVRSISGRNKGDVSDIFSGLSRQRFVGDFWHDEEYWNNPPGRARRIQMESFAHLFSAQQSDTRTHFKRFFPTAVKQFQQWLDNLTF